MPNCKIRVVDETERRVNNDEQSKLKETFQSLNSMYARPIIRVKCSF